MLLTKDVCDGLKGKSIMNFFYKRKYHFTDSADLMLETPI